jgi:hypothetical protein
MNPEILKLLAHLESHLAYVYRTRGYGQLLNTFYNECMYMRDSIQEK